MSLLLWAVGAATGGYAAIVGLMAARQRNLLHATNGDVPDPVAAGVAEMREVTLTAQDGQRLRAWWHPPPPGCPTLVFFHGNAGHLGDRGDKLRRYLDAGLGVLIPAWRGYSGNGGRPSEDGIYADARAALEFVARQGVKAERTVLYGESLGTAVAVRMASERRVAGVALEAPFTSIVDVAQYHYPWLPVRPLLIDRFDAVACVARIGAPLLIVHGEADPVVPVRFGRRLFAAAAEPKEARFVAGADHGNLYQHGMAELVCAFIDRHRREGAASHRGIG